MMRRLFLLLFALLLGLMFMACAPAVTPESIVTPTPTPAPAPAATPSVPTLTLWLPDWMALTDAAGHDRLMAAINAFEAEKGVQVVIIPKLPRGQGGLLDALRKTKPVAPSVLPDIVALPYQDIPQAAAADLLQPLGSQFSASLLDDYYDFARQAAQVDDAWVALPFASHFEHLSFQPAALSEPPVNWEIVLNSGATYAFPVGASDAMWTDALLLHYLSAVPAGETPERNAQALRQQLDFYEALYNNGQVDETAMQADAADVSWHLALQGNAPLAETTANLWLSQREEATFLRFGSTPSLDGHSRYLIHGWAFAIITADETHQALAADLINQLLGAQTLAEWSLQAHVLPSFRGALQLWPADDYRAFADEALANGFLVPAFTGDVAMTRAVHQAARAVLAGDLSAADAWQQATEGW